jgi:iron(III) transport system permease protein
VFLVIAVVLPTLAIAGVAFCKYWVGAFNFGPLTLKNIQYVIFEYPLTRVAIKNSLFLAVGGATTAVVFCIIIAYVLHRTKTKGRRELEFITTLPIGVPGMVLAMGFLLAYIKTPLYGTIVIMMIAYVTRFSPFALRTISAVLVSVQPELDESSRICGGSWIATLKNITLPLLKPGIAAAWLMLFIVFIRELNTSILLWSHGNEVMSVALYIILEQKLPGTTAAFAVVQTAMIFGLIVVLRRVIGMREMIM